MIKRLSGDGSAASAAGSGYEAPATNVGKAPDYSRTSCWLQIPEITKDVDTFFVYPTEYMGAAEDDPDYAPLDDSDMVQGLHQCVHAILPSVKCVCFEARL